jgi:branched-chain amino acid transport system substrate-binding protein
MSSFSSSRRNKKGAAAVAMLAAAALVLSGCAAETSNDGPDADGNLNLLLGTALPQTGNLAFLGPPEEAGVALAVKDINDANKGIKVSVEWGDSGDTDNKAYEAEVPRLLGAGVKAIIGAASSSTSLAFIDQVVGAGVIQFSPANTSPAFATYDDKGLYFRTAPSDALQGEVLGNLLAADGHETVSMIVLNDAYGTGLRDATQATFEAAGGTVLAAPLYNTGDTNFTSQVSEALAGTPDALVLITFEEIKTMLPSILSQYDAENIYLVDGNLAQYGEEFEAGALEGIKGTKPGPVNPDAAVTFNQRVEDNWVAEGNPTLGGEYTYADGSYDAVVLLALAALAAKSTASAAMAGKLIEVTGGSGSGTKCDSFAACADIINDGGVADYDGITGPITFDANGEVTAAKVDVYVYDSANMYALLNK